MGTFRDRNHIKSETNPVVSFSHLTWFHPANFYQAHKTSLNHLHSTSIHVNTEPVFTISPVTFTATGTEAPKNLNFETKASKSSKKPKQSKKSSNDTTTPKVLKPMGKRSSGSKKEKTTIVGKREKKDQNIDITAMNLDFSGVPSPVCSCTGEARVCYKWGLGGWQSSCCTINISEYPLPVRSTRPGARMAGRKMSNGAYGKLLIKLACEGYDLNHPVDLKSHWARHGTNKFVTIK